MSNESHPAPAVPQADALPVSLVRAYNAGYMAGHHDTVEGGFVDIHPSDMDTYHADVVAELGLPAAPQSEPIDPHMIVAEDRFPDAQVEPKPTPASGDDLNVYREMADSYRNDAQAEPKRSQPLLDLLAVIHCDGGDHTEAVGIERSIKNAQDAVCALKVRLALAEPKRDWTAVDAAIREYLDDYELIGEDDAGADACYTPTERELYLIYDAITGLLADESFVAAISAPRAEPKREPLSDERIDTALQTDPVLITRLMIGSMTVGEFRAALRRLARIVERALEIGGSDAE